MTLSGIDGVFGPKDISSTKDSEPVQPRNITFLSHLIGKQYGAFTTLLFDKYLWIEYSQAEEAIYCFHWRNFPGSRQEPVFVSQGSRN